MGKVKTKKVDHIDLKNSQGETVLLWKVTSPLSELEYEMLSERVRSEEERAGIRIVLVPYSVDPSTMQLTSDISDDDNDSNKQPDDDGKADKPANNDPSPDGSGKQDEKGDE